MNKLLFVCGGTGGHIYPAIAVADELSDYKKIFVGSADRLESDVVPDNGYTLLTISAHRKSLISNITAIFQSIRILHTEKPSCVIATGGYITFPMIVASIIMRVPFVLMESNAWPGKVNRWLGKWAKKVFVSHESTVQKFKKNGEYTGNPIRIKRTKITPPRLSGYDQGKPAVLVFGGSQGAQKINETVIDLAKQKKLEQYKVIIVSGHKNYEELKQYEKYGIEIVSYIDDLPRRFEEVDLVVCRAGATTVAELSAYGPPAILIPFPYASENHQYYNAKVLSDAGAASLLSEDKLTAEQLLSEIIKLTEAPVVRSEMISSLRKLAKPEAARVIADRIRELVND